MDRTTALIILAAVAVGVFFLVSLARRLRWPSALRSTWDDIWSSALLAARAIRAHPRALAPGAVAMSLGAASWLLYRLWTMWLSDAWRQYSWDQHLRDLPHAPAMVVAYAWASMRPPGDLETVVVAVLALALIVTLRWWLPRAAAHGAAASAEFLPWLLGCLVTMGVLTSVVPRVVERRGLTDLGFALLSVVAAAAWKAAVAGAVLTAVSGAIRGRDTRWGPALVWGTLRHFRSLFWLSLWITLPYRAADLVAAFDPRWYWHHWRTVHHLTAPFDWVFVALVLLPAIIVCEGTGALEGTRLGLRTWWRAPLHLAIAVALGSAVWWLAGLAGWLAIRTVEGPAPVAVVMGLGGFALRAVVMTWAAGLAVLLWQHLRDRVTAGL